MWKSAQIRCMGMAIATIPIKYTNNKQTAKMNTESLIGYAIDGSEDARKMLAEQGLNLPEMITVVNGKPVSPEKIMQIHAELLMVCDKFDMEYAVAREHLRKAIEGREVDFSKPSKIVLAPATIGSVRMPGQRKSKHRKPTPSNLTPAKKKRKK